MTLPAELKVNEIFGPTIQGEGSSAGRHCLFVRLAQCNLHCSWCDTPYTWAFTEHKASLHREGKQYDVGIEQKLMTGAEIFAELGELWDMRRRPTTVVISGGEPMLQQKALTDLIRTLTSYGHRVEIETAGTIVPTEQWARHVHFNVSPKLEHSGNSLIARRNIKALDRLATLDSIFKFVVGHPRDYVEVKEIIDGTEIKTSQVWIMPEGVTLQETRDHGREIVNYAISQGWNFTLRTHVVLWGTERAK